MTDPETVFSIEGLRVLLGASSEPYLRFRDWDGSGVLLRFDVDFDLRAAEAVATALASWGVRATFFVLTTGDTYNVLSARSQARLRAMVDLGFEIGLHFDPTVYPASDDADLARRMDEERRLLARATGEPVTSVSLHNPSVHGTYPMFDGVLNAYDPRLFEDRRYLADSRRSFRGKDPVAFLRSAGGSGVTSQVVLHPEHYPALRTGAGYRGMVHSYLVAVCSEIDEMFSVNSTFVDELAGSSSGAMHLRATGEDESNRKDGLV